MKVHKIAPPIVKREKRFETQKKTNLSFEGAKSPSVDNKFFSNLGIWFKKKLNLFNVKTDKDYIVESFLVPMNLESKGRIVVIGTNAVVKGVYKAAESIEFFGKLVPSGTLQGKDIMFYSSSKVAGKVRAEKSIRIAGVAKESSEFYAPKIIVHPGAVIKGKLNADEIIYLNKD